MLDLPEMEEGGRGRQRTEVELQKKYYLFINTIFEVSAYPVTLWENGAVRLIFFVFSGFVFLQQSMNNLVKNAHIVNFDIPDQGANAEARRYLQRVLHSQFVSNFLSF